MTRVSEETDRANVPEKDMQYIQQKKEEIKAAAKDGRPRDAERAAVQILQHLGVDGYEMPIESELDELE